MCTAKQYTRLSKQVSKFIIISTTSESAGTGKFVRERKPSTKSEISQNVAAMNTIKNNETNTI